MKKLNTQKNKKIQSERGAGIEEVIAEGTLLDIRANPKYPGQFIEIYHYQNYVWAVITGKDPERYITMHKSRKLKKEFGK